LGLGGGAVASRPVVQEQVKGLAGNAPRKVAAARLFFPSPSGLG